MNACTFMFVLIFCEALAFSNLDDYSNVGSVLFTPSDTRKKSWSEEEMGLLRARQYFQSVIPPPNAINTINDNYVDTLLKYFRDGFSSIKQVAADPEADGIMTRALSDAVGGYLKVWMLPITKFAFYGGTVSQEKAVRLFEFYDGLKTYLETDGKSWLNPSATLLNSISIDIAPPRTSVTRSADENACDSLAFFENTSSGFVVPIPNVNWQDKASTMFVPLKNYSLVPLNSANFSDTLFKYYETAKHCIQRSSLEDKSKFDERFQSWLDTEVVPHLNDENLYLALGSVLTLVNKTNNLCDTVVDLYSDKQSSNIGKTLIAGRPVELSSKEIIIITIIIFLEIAWCIPALLYILCSKIKRTHAGKVFINFDKKTKNNSKKATKNKSQLVNKTKINNTNKQKESLCGLFDPGCMIAEVTHESKHRINTKNTKFQICANKDSNNQANQTIHKIYAHKENQTYPKYIKCTDSRGISLRQNPRSAHLAIEAMFSASNSRHSVGTGTRSNFCTQIYDPGKAIHEYRISTPRSLKRTTIVEENIVANKPIGSPSSREVYCCFPDNYTSSFSKVQELEATKTVTLLKEVEKQQKGESIKDSSTSKTNDSIGVMKHETMNQCTYVSCRRECKTKSIKVSSNKPKTKVSHREESIVARNQIIKKTKAKGHKKMNANKPHVEITIDKPQKDFMCVDITGSIKSSKPSKIPTLSYKNNVSQTVSIASKKTQVPMIGERRSYGRSFIPQPKKRAADDTAIGSKPATVKGKLNTTL